VQPRAGCPSSSASTRDGGAQVCGRAGSNLRRTELVRLSVIVKRCSVLDQVVNRARDKMDTVRAWARLSSRGPAVDRPARLGERACCHQQRYVGQARLGRFPQKGRATAFAPGHAHPGWFKHSIWDSQLPYVVQVLDEATLLIVRYAYGRVDSERRVSFTRKIRVCASRVDRRPSEKDLGSFPRRRSGLEEFS
jgi:hypothetical protein